jgi:hypothetical protein
MNWGWSTGNACRYSVQQSLESFLVLGRVVVARCRNSLLATLFTVLEGMLPFLVQEMPLPSSGSVLHGQRLMQQRL